MAVVRSFSTSCLSHYVMGTLYCDSNSYAVNRKLKVLVERGVAMAKPIGYTTQGFLEYVPPDDEKYDVLLKCLGEETPSQNADVLVMHEPGFGFYLMYRFPPREISEEELEELNNYE